MYYLVKKQNTVLNSIMATFPSGKKEGDVCVCSSALKKHRERIVKWWKDWGDGAGTSGMRREQFCSENPFVHCFDSWRHSNLLYSRLSENK